MSMHGWNFCQRIIKHTKCTLDKSLFKAKKSMSQLNQLQNTLKEPSKKMKFVTPKENQWIKIFKENDQITKYNNKHIK